jgi:hypothetical protein
MEVYLFIWSCCRDMKKIITKSGISPNAGTLNRGFTVCIKHWCCIQHSSSTLVQLHVRVWHRTIHIMFSSRKCSVYILNGLLNGAISINNYTALKSRLLSD